MRERVAILFEWWISTVCVMWERRWSCVISPGSDVRKSSRERGSQRSIRLHQTSNISLMDSDDPTQTSSRVTLFLIEIITDEEIVWLWTFEHRWRSLTLWDYCEISQEKHLKFMRKNRDFVICLSCGNEQGSENMFYKRRCQTREKKLGFPQSVCVWGRRMFLPRRKQTE